MIKHVWFDLEGTLYRTSSEAKNAHDKLVYKTLSELLDEHDFTKVKQSYNKLYKDFGSNSAVFRSLGKSSDFWQKTYENLDIEKFIKPDEKVNKALAEIKKSIPISIYTNFRLGRTNKILKKLDLAANFFKFILTGDDVIERKPQLAGFKKIIELSRLSPDEILYVGDRLETDIIPAEKAGLVTCLAYSYSPLADLCAGSFKELVRKIRNYN